MLFIFQWFENQNPFLKSAIIDNLIFRLHYRVTFIILIVLCIIVSWRNYFNDPIDCMSGDDIPSFLLDTFCWIHPTFSLEKAWKKTVGVEVPYPGVDKTTPKEEKVYHAYYQWVWLVLFIQAFFFYGPGYFWKTIEGGKTQKLVLGLDSPIIQEETKCANIDLIVKYLYRNLNKNNTLFIVYSVAEGLNLLNVILQIIILDLFLSGEFANYGWAVIGFSGWDPSISYNPMLKVFPRLTKCTFHRYGRSGVVQRHDALCVLPMNILYEKMFLFLWFWFYFLMLLSFLVLVYRAIIIFNPRVRVLVTQWRHRDVNRDTLDSVINKCQIGDWFVLQLLAKNFHSNHFNDMLANFNKNGMNTCCNEDKMCLKVDTPLKSSSEEIESQTQV